MQCRPSAPGTQTLRVAQRAGAQAQRREDREVERLRHFPGFLLQGRSESICSRLRHSSRRSSSLVLARCFRTLTNQPVSPSRAGTQTAPLMRRVCIPVHGLVPLSPRQVCLSCQLPPESDGFIPAFLTAPIGSLPSATSQFPAFGQTSEFFQNGAPGTQPSCQSFLCRPLDCPESQDCSFECLPLWPGLIVGEHIVFFQTIATHLQPSPMARGVGRPEHIVLGLKTKCVL